MPTAPTHLPVIGGKVITPDLREPGHWCWLSLLGWHDCHPLEDQAINKEHPMRYQVLYTENGESKIEHFRTKAQAQGRVRALKKKGLKAELWDTLNNPMSKLFRF